VRLRSTSVCQILVRTAPLAKTNSDITLASVRQDILVSRQCFFVGRGIGDFPKRKRSPLLLRKSRSYGVVYNNHAAC